MGKLNLGVIVAKIDVQNQVEGVHIVMPEPIFYKELARSAAMQNIDVYIFSPSEWTEQGLYGFRLYGNVWRREIVQLPDIVYDRCFFTNARQRQACEDTLDAIKRKKNYKLFNNNLPSKLMVYEALRTVEELIPYLPHTEQLSKLSIVPRWLSIYTDGVVVKPAAGMHGKGVLHITHDRTTMQYVIRGRNLRNERVDACFSNELNALKWLYRFKKELAYLIQPYLVLRTEDQKPFDIRVLMQKDAAGVWQLTGSMARVGFSNGLTSNIHGGGEASEPLPLLAAKMGDYKAERLLNKIHMISGQTVSAIESHFGRFGELALDFGITPQGSIWLLECNSKPGRQAFSGVNNNLENERPLQYAKHLQQRVTANQIVI
ncbi:YheC/YheD family protein [Paenibacillus camelliae]|uniref:YheC/YheD family endospore coat-associated protein n=1 Tax=Paenibacillus camelliae TaxID=512410 RepID=UPI002041476B|nr:YheC/YheD family protein [Paenibacillus camelliae]MCM3632528.1 YheC/YheD family protein [Paenibacillus camelliae]